MVNDKMLGESKIAKIQAADRLENIAEIIFNCDLEGAKEFFFSGPGVG